jgi:L-gulonolactone oxidase
VEEKPLKDEIWLTRYPEWLKQYDFVRILWLPHTGYGYTILGRKTDPGLPVQEKKAPRFIRHRRNFSQFLYRLTVRFPKFTVIANRILRHLFFSHQTRTVGTLYQATVTKSRGSTLELAEWTVSIDRFQELFRELKNELKSRHNRTFIHIPMDIRFIRQDGIPLSYASDCDAVTMGCVSRIASNADRYEAFKLIERIFLKYRGRPHWAKRFEAKKEKLKTLYPEFLNFIEYRKKLDPEGKFLNPYLKEIFN